MDKELSIPRISLLQEENSNQALHAQGYITFPFLEAKELKQLSDYYFEFQKEDPQYFYASTHSPDYAFRRKTSDFIKSVIENKLRDTFKDFRLLGGAFVAKPPKGKGILQAHQDWNLVDETKYRSYNIWIPLVDVNTENGAVYVLPKSHAKLQTYRGPGIPSLFKNIEQQAWTNLQPLLMNAGEALLYDHALLHGSPANNTEHIRLGIVCGVVPKEAEIQLCFGKGEAVEIYSASEDFFLDKDPMKGPEGLILKTVVTEAAPLLTNESYHQLFIKDTIQKKSWFKRWFG